MSTAKTSSRNLKSSPPPCPRPTGNSDGHHPGMEMNDVSLSSRYEADERIKSAHAQMHAERKGGNESVPRFMKPTVSSVIKRKSFKDELLEKRAKVLNGGKGQKCGRKPTAGCQTHTASLATVSGEGTDCLYAASMEVHLDDIAENMSLGTEPNQDETHLFSQTSFDDKMTYVHCALAEGVKSPSIANVRLSDGVGSIQESRSFAANNATGMMTSSEGSALVPQVAEADGLTDQKSSMSHLDDTSQQNLGVQTAEAKGASGGEICHARGNAIPNDPNFQSHPIMIEEQSQEIDPRDDQDKPNLLGAVSLAAGAAGVAGIFGAVITKMFSSDSNILVVFLEQQHAGGDLND